MSGGVDSSVAAALLTRAGYSVTGAYMINYSDESCWLTDYRDALRVAAHQHIPLLKLDFTEEYRHQVLDYMFAEYEAGRTPNPDVWCNKYIKFGAWLDKARELGFDYLATGHYAVLNQKSNQTLKLVSTKSSQLVNSKKKPATPISLMESKDKNKDQTYFLHQLTQDQLCQVMFPIGNYTKNEVRKLARKFILPTAEKEESMGICFIGEVPMKEFLQKRLPVRPGNIVLSNSSNSFTIIGQHEGLPFYTIGQRHVGDVSRKSSQGEQRPLYVIDKQLATNELVLGYEDNPLLYKKNVSVSLVNWLSGQTPRFPIKCKVRLRHRQIMQAATIKEGLNRESAVVSFTHPQRAVTPGQFAVFYKNGECLGGGVIG